MTDDRRVICGFMEPKPSELYERPLPQYGDPQKWWVYQWSAINQRFLPVPNSDLVDTLDGLHLVENKLPFSDADKYTDALSDCVGALLWNATVEQKQKALAAVIREIE